MIYLDRRRFIWFLSGHRTFLEEQKPYVKGLMPRLEGYDGICTEDVGYDESETKTESTKNKKIKETGKNQCGRVSS